jgi:hypothetical protein
MTQMYSPNNVMPGWLDLASEKVYWAERYTALPCYRSGDNFEDCWPQVEAVYRLYVDFPRATLEESVRLYEHNTKHLRRELTDQQTRELFARVWARILKVARGRAIMQWGPGVAH